MFRTNNFIPTQTTLHPYAVVIMADPITRSDVKDDMTEIASLPKGKFLTKSEVMQSIKATNNVKRKARKTKAIFRPVQNVTTTTVVRLRRQKDGTILQDCDVYIGRQCTMGGWNLKQSKWHNPFKVGRDCKTVEECVAKYEAHVRSKPELMASLPELRSKRCGCWCKPKPCHGDVLVKLVNEHCK